MQTPSDLSPSGIPLEKEWAHLAALSFIYRYLAKAYEYPDEKEWNWVRDPSTLSVLQSAVREVEGDKASTLKASAADLGSHFTRTSFDDYRRDYHVIFGHTARGSCPMNEIEYGETKADPLFQPHRLADLAAFYRVFGLELTPDAPERQDHISIECEFMSVLTAREIHALHDTANPEHLSICRDAQVKFMGEHLGRWVPSFVNLVVHQAHESGMATLATFTRRFISGECARLRVTEGNDHLMLRPVDEAEESLCGSCGIQSLPPGA